MPLSLGQALPVLSWQIDLAKLGRRRFCLEVGGPSYGITGGKEKPEWLSGQSLSRVDVPGYVTTTSLRWRPKQCANFPLDKSIFSGSKTLLCPPGIVNSYQACTIGGNSAINAGLYFQPPASDWDNYHPKGWKSADVRNATRRLLAKQKSVTAYSRDDKFYLQSGYKAAQEWLVDFCRVFECVLQC